MTHKKSKMALGLIALAVVASGCTQGSGGSVQTSQSTGVAIQGFSAHPASVLEGGTVRLNVNVQNLGGSEASNVRMRIFNIPFGGGEGAWSGDRSLSFPNMRPPDPEANIPSVPREQTINLDAPTIDEDINHDYRIKGRLLYNYQTTGITEVEIMGWERFRDIGATRRSPSVENTGGPIQIEVETRTPIIVPDEDSQFCIRVNNVGDGTPYLPGRIGGGQPEDNPDALRRVELSLQSPEISLSPLDGDNIVEMVDGSGGKCYEYTGIGGDPNIQTTVPITINADYGYMTEETALVTVQGR